MMARRFLLPLGLVIVLSLFVAPGAVAGTAQSLGGLPKGGVFVTYVAKDGEENNVRVRAAGAAIEIEDNAGITPGAGCFRPNPGVASVARCTLGEPRNPYPVSVDLGDRDDTFVVAGLAVGVSGGDDDDSINGSSGADLLDGGGGQDNMRGGRGNDRIEGGPGPDSLSGGLGRDTVSYAREEGRVRADLAGDRDDGAPGERDLVLTDVENLQGGQGGSRLTGNRAANRLTGGDGHDVIAGGRGNDVLEGTYNPGSSLRRPGDRFNGGRGNDRIIGSQGNDLIDGGGGRDRIRAGRGRDRIRVRDRSRDRVDCGLGFDRASANVFDRLRGCERVRRRR